MMELTMDVPGEIARPRRRPRVADELVSFLAPSSFESDQYRALRHRVEIAHVESGLKVLAVTSAVAGEGKTVTLLNLAGALAQSPTTRILVIDADLRRPTVASYLRLTDSGAASLGEGLSQEDVPLARLARRIDSLNISVIVAGSGYEAEAYELLASDRFRALIAEARRTYDYVLIDTPPLVPLPDCRLMTPSIDGLVLVVAAHSTPRAIVNEALSLVDMDQVVAVAFNRDQRRITPYYRYYGNPKARQKGSSSRP